MMRTDTIIATTGNDLTTCSVFTFKVNRCESWYAIKGSREICLCDSSDLIDGVDIDSVHIQDIRKGLDVIEDEGDLQELMYGDL